MDAFTRVRHLLGKENFDKISCARVAVFGVGGVGGFAVEGLVRSGVNNLTVIDNDDISLSNINRQIIADTTTVGKSKIDQIILRAKAINPNININGIKAFYLPENADIIDFSAYDYIIDAVDTVTAKLEIIKRAKLANVKIISSMGTAGKLNPQNIRVADISKTQNCPLARVIRRELKKLNITDVNVVYSEELPFTPLGESEETSEKCVPPSMMFVPATAGLTIASKVIQDLIK